MPPISYHVSAERFTTQEEADTFGKESAKSNGYIYLGVRASMNVDVHEILHVNQEVPLRDDLKGRQHQRRNMWFSAVWVSVDPEPTTPIRIDSEGKVVDDEP